MAETDVFDTHLCLACNQTVLGLMNYVHHKQTQCPAAKSRHADQTKRDVTSAPVPQSSATVQQQYGFQDARSSQHASSVAMATADVSGHYVTNDVTDDLTNRVVYDVTGHVGSDVSYANERHHVTSGDSMFGSMSGGSCKMSYSAPGPSLSCVPSTTALKPGAMLTGSDRETTAGSLSHVISPPSYVTSAAQPEPDVTQSLSVHVSSPLSSFLSASLSPEPPGVTHAAMMGQTESCLDFFQSLQLKSASSSKGHGTGASRDLQNPLSANPPDGHGKNNDDDNVDEDDDDCDLPIANILSTLDFSSDDLEFASDEFASDRDDDEDDVNNDDDDDGDGAKPPSSHTGGKWRPGEGPSRKSLNSKPQHSIGKWRPGENPLSKVSSRPGHPGGKWRPGWGPGTGKVARGPCGRGKGAASKKLPPNVGPTPSTAYHCEACDVYFHKKILYAGHCRSREHKQRKKAAGNSGEGASTSKATPRNSSSAAATRGKSAVSEEVGVSGALFHGESSVKSTEPESKDSAQETMVSVTRHSLSFSAPDPGANNAAQAQPSTASTASSEGVSPDVPEETSNARQGPSHHCTVCDKRYFFRFEMIRHLQSSGHRKRAAEHGDAAALEELYARKDEDSRPSPSRTQHHTCQVCDRTFLRKFEMARHLTSRFHRNRAKGHPAAMTVLDRYAKCVVRFCPFQCHVCRFYFNQPQFFLQHLQSPSHVTRVGGCLGALLCLGCKYKARNNAELVQHVQSEAHRSASLGRQLPCVVKESHVQVACKFCSVVTHSAVRMRQHMATYHADGKVHDPEVKCQRRRGQERPVCPVCGVLCASPYALTYHMRSRHTKERPFKCDACNRSFYRKRELTLHLMTRLHAKRVQRLATVASFGHVVGKSHPGQPNPGPAVSRQTVPGPAIPGIASSGTSSSGTSGSGPSSSGTSGFGTSGSRASGSRTSISGTYASGIFGSGASSSRASASGTSSSGISGSRTSGSATSSSKASGCGTFTSGVSAPGTSNSEVSTSVAVNDGDPGGFGVVLSLPDAASARSSRDDPPSRNRSSSLPGKRGRRKRKEGSGSHTADGGNSSDRTSKESGRAGGRRKRRRRNDVQSQEQEDDNDASTMDAGDGGVVTPDSAVTSENAVTSGRSAGKVYKCDHCPYRCSSADELLPHCLEEHPSDVISCDPCSQQFLSTKSYRIHCAGRYHQEMIRRLEQEVGGQGVISCGTCGLRFTEEKYYNFHVEYYHNHVHSEAMVQQIYQGKDQVSQLYGEHLKQLEQLPADYQVACPECGRFFKNATLVEHLRLHTGERPYRCRFCEKSFSAGNSLRRHLNVHLDVVAQTCELCGQEFRRYGAYRHHMQKHQNERAGKKHICEVCGQTFLVERVLRAHMRRHGERKYKCTHKGCNWKFVLQSELQMHMAVHTGEKKFLCDICGFGATTKTRLLRHWRTHSGERKFNCEYCTYKAGSKNHLRRHMRIHIGSKPFQCPYCSYSCNTYENLRKHISKTKKHQGLKIYPCKFCDFGTNSGSDFRDHLIENHPFEIKGESLESLSEFTGLYKKTEDPRIPPEGTQIIQAKERNPRQPRNVKVPKLPPEPSMLTVDQYLTVGSRREPRDTDHRECPGKSYGNQWSVRTIPSISNKESGRAGRSQAAAAATTTAAAAAAAAAASSATASADASTTSTFTTATFTAATFTASNNPTSSYATSADTAAHLLEPIPDVSLSQHSETFSLHPSQTGGLYLATQGETYLPGLTLGVTLTNVQQTGQLCTSNVREFTTSNVREFTTSNAGEFSTSNAGEFSTSNAGEFPTSNVREFSTSNAGQFSTSNAEEFSTSNPREFSSSSAREFSTSNAGEFSTSNAVEFSTSNAGEFSTPNAVEFSTSNAGEFSTPNAVEFSTSNAGEFSTPNAGEFCTSNAGEVANVVVLPSTEEASFSVHNSLHGSS